MLVTGLGLNYSFEEKTFLNEMAIRHIESKEGDNKQIAYIRGRQLFAIRPDNWKGWNLIGQIWFLFNKVIRRYELIERSKFDNHFLYQATVKNVNSEKYLNWRKQHFSFLIKKDKVQKLKNKLKELLPLKTKSDEFLPLNEALQKLLHDQVKDFENLRTKFTELNELVSELKKENHDLKSKPDLDTYLNFYTQLEKLKTLLSTQQQNMLSFHNLINDPINGQIQDAEEKLNRLHELYARIKANEKSATVLVNNIEKKFPEKKEKQISLSIV